MHMVGRSGSKFPVGKTAKLIKQGRYGDKLGAGAPVFVAAVLEYLASEIIELAHN